MPILTHFWPDPGVFAACVPTWKYGSSGCMSPPRAPQPATCPAHPLSHALGHSSQTTSLRVASGLHMCIVGLAGGFENSLSQLPTLKTLGNSHKHPDFRLPLQSLSLCRHGAGIPTWPCGAGLEPPWPGRCAFLVASVASALITPPPPVPGAGGLSLQPLT